MGYSPLRKGVRINVWGRSYTSSISKHFQNISLSRRLLGAISSHLLLCTPKIENSSKMVENVFGLLQYLRNTKEKKSHET